MKDEKKTKDELITELIELRQRITDLRASEIQRKQTEEALHREKYRILVKESPLGVSIIGRDGHYRYINPKFVEIFGYTLEDIPTGREWFAKAYPDQEYRNQVISTWINDLKESKCGESRPRTFIVTCKDGSERVVYFRPVTMETGEHFVIYEDITERKRAEEELQESEEKFKTILENAHDVIFQLSPLGFIQYVSPKVKELYGYDPEDLIGKHLQKTTPISEFPKALKAVRSVLSGKVVKNFEINQLDSKGKVFHMEINASPVRKEGKIIAVEGIMRDITERRRAEEEIKRARDDYLTITNLTGEIIVKVDREGRWTFLNDGACEFWGRPREELIGGAFSDYLHPDDQEKTMAVVEEVKTKKLVRGLVNRQKIPQGWRTVEWNAAAIFDKEGRYVGIQATGRDITERKQMEEALTHERNLLQALIDNIPDAIYFKDDKNRFIRVNKARTDLSGTTPENMMGKTDFDFFPQEQARQAFADDSRVMESNRPLVDKVEKITHADGTEHWVSVTKIPRHNEKGKVIGTMGISRDITKRKQQEEQLANMATHDTLTGLANRALFSDHLTLALARAQRNRQKFPIMLLDLDNFKDVNDRLGHSGGDKLLQAVGDRLNGILRKADAVARMGGDEFLLLLAETSKTEDIDLVAQKILVAFQRPFLLGDHQVRTTTSIGIAIYPSDGKDADSLIKNADIAMYYAKEKGRNNYQYYAAAVDTQDIANS